MSNHGDDVERTLVRVIMLGDSGVGKTEFCNCFKTKVFSGTTQATIGVEFTAVAMDLCDGKLLLNVQLYDTAGAERFGNTLVRSYFRGADAAIIVFDLQNDESLTRAIRQFQDITAERVGIVVVFVANKLDLLELQNQNDTAYRDARFAKLRMLVESAQQARQASPDHDYSQLNQGIRFISLVSTPTVAYDIMQELAQRVAFNNVKLHMKRQKAASFNGLGSSGLSGRSDANRLTRSHSTSPNIEGAGRTIKLKRLERIEAAEAAKAKKEKTSWCF